MEVIRQQNEELDKLASELAKAKHLVEERAAEVEQAARLKSEFLANFSHEIRTPLNGILGYCDLLMREEGSRLTPHGRRDLNVVKSNARTLLALINDILDLSKIEAGRVDVAKERVDVGALIEECAADRPRDPQRQRRLAALQRRRERAQRPQRFAQAPAGHAQTSVQRCQVHRQRRDRGRGQGARAARS